MRGVWARCVACVPCGRGARNCGAALPSQDGHLVSFHGFRTCRLGPSFYYMTMEKVDGAAGLRACARCAVCVWVCRVWRGYEERAAREREMDWVGCRADVTDRCPFAAVQLLMAHMAGVRPDAPRECGPLVGAPGYSACHHRAARVDMLATLAMPRRAELWQPITVSY